MTVTWYRRLSMGLVLLCAISFLAFGQAGPIGNWKFDNGTGTVATDASGNNNNGSVVGATWTTGKVAGALDFNGSNASVRVPNSASLAFPNQVTIAAWINGRSFAEWSTILPMAHFRQSIYLSPHSE